MTKKPNSRANLDRAIERLFGNYEKSLETRSIMANAIVGRCCIDEAVAWANELIGRIAGS